MGSLEWGQEWSRNETIAHLLEGVSRLRPEGGLVWGEGEEASEDPEAEVGGLEEGGLEDGGFEDEEEEEDEETGISAMPSASARSERRACMTRSVFS